MANGFIESSGLSYCIIKQFDLLDVLVTGVSDRMFSVFVLKFEDKWKET